MEIHLKFWLNIYHKRCWFIRKLHSSGTEQKIKFFIKDFFSKFDQIRMKLRIWSHLLKKSFMKNFIFLCSVCSKASRKIYALAKVAPYMYLSKRCILMITFFNSQFRYCPLIWIFNNRTTNRKINGLDWSYLCITYNDKQSSFEEFLEKDGSVSIRDRNIH